MFRTWVGGSGFVLNGELEAHDGALTLRTREFHLSSVCFDDAVDDWNHVGSSGVLSTVGDLYRWHRALLGDSLLSASAKARMYTPVANGYGYGWYISETDRGLLVEHDGGSSRGSGGDFARYLDEDLTLVVLSNRDAEYMLFGARLVEMITRIVFGEEIEPPPAVPADGAVVGKGFAGEYRFADGSSVAVQEVGSLLELRGTGQHSVAALLALSEEEAASHAAVNARTAEILSSVVAGEYSALEAASSERVGPGLRSLFENLADSLGGPTGFTVAGTAPPTGVEAAEHMTLFRVDYPSRSNSFRFYWGAGRIVALGGAGLSEPVRLRALLTGEGEALGYHVSTARSTRFRVRNGADGHPSGLDFGERFGVALRVADDAP